MANAGITIRFSGYILADDNDIYNAIYDKINTKYSNIWWSFTVGGGFFHASKDFVFDEKLKVVIHAILPRIDRYKSYPTFIHIRDEFVALLPRSNDEQHPFEENISEILTKNQSSPIFDFREENILEEIIEYGYSSIFKRYNLLHMAPVSQQEKIKKQFGISSLTMDDLVSKK